MSGLRLCSARAPLRTQRTVGKGFQDHRTGCQRSPRPADPKDWKHRLRLGRRVRQTL